MTKKIFIRYTVSRRHIAYAQLCNNAWWGEGGVGIAGPVWKYAEVAAISPRQGLYIQYSTP
jgi:hypothetical protein